MKVKTVYSCQECGAQSQKWLGRCPECEAWNSLVEERPVPTTAGAGAASAGAGAGDSLAATAGARLYEDIDTVVSTRLTAGIEEVDLVFRGGVVPRALGV